MAYIVVAYIVMAYTVLAFIIMAYIFMVYIVMATFFSSLSIVEYSPLIYSMTCGSRSRRLSSMPDMHQKCAWSACFCTASAACGTLPACNDMCTDMCVDTCTDMHAHSHVHTVGKL